MRAISLLVLSACIALMISGCSGKKMTEPMISEMSGMEKSMNNMDSMDNKDDTMTKDSMTQPIKPQAKEMNKTM